MSKLATKQGTTMPSNITQSKICSGACLWRIFLVAPVWDVGNHAALPGTGEFPGKTFSVKTGSIPGKLAGSVTLMRKKGAATLPADL